MKTIGQAMREAREDIGYNMSQLEKLSGVPRSLISGYERGKYLPGLEKLIALADALETSIDDYIGHEVKE